MFPDLGPIKVNITCADQGIFSGRGGRGYRPDGKKTALTAFFCLFVLCSSQPINRGVPMVLFQRGSIIFQGVQLFPGMGGGGVQMLISIETHI